jgi:hypothetical protein
MNEAVIHETEAAPPIQGRSAQGSAQSCRNAIRDGCRSITEFPIDMQQRIDARYAERCAELEPKTSLERELILEMARAEIQKDVAHRLRHDPERIRQAVEETWDEDQRRHTNNLAARLPRDPQRVAELLLQTKHGAEWALTTWRGLAASARENHGLTEPQRQLLCDLKGVSPLLRDNTDTVPAASDEARLLALITREVKALETRLVLELEGRDKRARAMAKLGPLPPPDAATRKYKSDEARANKRWGRAFDSFKWVRAGMPASALTDPLTGKPLQEAAPAKTPEPPPASAGGGAAAPAAPPASDPAAGGPGKPAGDNSPIPVPGHLGAEHQEAFLVVGAMLREMIRAGLVNPPTTAPPKTE